MLMMQKLLILLAITCASISFAEEVGNSVEAPALPERTYVPPPEELESDEPAVFQDDSIKVQPKALEQPKIEEKPAELMEADRPGFIPLFFDPEKNGVRYGHQEIEYDLTDPLILRIGPLAVTAAGVHLRVSRETGEMFQFEFGLEMKKSYANMYMISFQWPAELVPGGMLELFNDKGQVLWRRQVDEYDIASWRTYVKPDAKPINLGEKVYGREDKDEEERNKFRVGGERLKVTGHDQSSFGLFGRQIFEIPIWKIKTPFRFCVTKDAPEGRVAICSKRYRFVRKGGRYWAIAESKSVVPKVFVNDERVTLKGSAVFVDNKRPIKFAALMGNGTYFEFVSYPKRITIVDMVLNEDKKLVEVMGYGPPPLGDVVRVDRLAKDYWDFLNFMPTIGDFRKFWKATFPLDGGSLYLRGYGGAPFKQPFVFDKLPRKRVRPLIHVKSPRSTYSRTVSLQGETRDPVKASSSEVSAESTTPTSFEWEFLAEKRGHLNQAEILIQDGETTFRAFHDIYKGFPRELSARASGVVSSSLEIIVLAEVAFQWWFERLLWWDHPLYSHQRWGVNAKYFQAVTAIGGQEGTQSLIELAVATADLKYRLTPGIWGRDHTLGISLNAQNVRFEGYSSTMAGVGLFWARSMPKVFDVMFNVLPIMRYPKWVDMEGILYLLPLDSRSVLGVNGAVNFHGKVLWTDQFFGEGGFGLKVYQFGDLIRRQEVGLAVLYGTIGVGYNF